MKSNFRKFICSLLVSTLTLSAMPTFNIMDVYADTVSTKQVHLEQIKNAPSDKYDLMFLFEDRGDARNRDLKSVTEELQERAIRILEKAKSEGKTESYKSFFTSNAIHAVITDISVVEQIVALEEVIDVAKDEPFQVVVPIEEVESQSTSTFIYEPDERNIEWGVKAVHADKVWDDFRIDGSGVTVGIIDTGVNYKLPALKVAYKGYDSATDSFDPAYYRDFLDPSKTEPEASFVNNHGTHVAGTILGKEADGVNQIGVAPGAKFISARAIDSQKLAKRSTILDAADWMYDMRPDIVNASWGGELRGDSWFKDMAETFEEAGIILVVAAGNDDGREAGAGSIYHPASLLNVISVGAVDRENRIAKFSRRGPSSYDRTGKVIKPELSAPGVAIRSVYAEGGYTDDHGTSMAAPHVTGVLALVKQANPDITMAEAKELLTSTAQPLTDERYPNSPNMAYGYGLVNAYDAVAKLEGRQIGSISGTIKRNGIRNMSAYEELVVSQSETVESLPYEINEAFELNGFYDLAPIRKDVIQADTRLGITFGRSEDMQNVSVQISESKEPESFQTLEAINSENNTPVQREYSLAAYSGDSDYVYIRIRQSTSADSVQTPISIQGISVAQISESGQQNTQITADGSYNPDAAVIAQANTASSQADNPGDFSARPGEVTGGAAPRMVGEEATLEAPRSEGEVEASDNIVLQDIPYYGSAEIATVSDAVSSHRVISEQGEREEFVSNQPDAEDSVIKSQTLGGEAFLSTDADYSTSDELNGERGTGVSADATTHHAEAGDAPALQDLDQIPINAQNLNVRIPFKPLIKVKNSGKSVYADEASGEFSLTHAVNTPETPLRVEISAYGYETKVIEVDLNQSKDQRLDVSLDPSPIATAFGRVTDEHLNPVDGVKANIIEDDYVEEISSDVNGQYRIKAAYAGYYTVRYSKFGYLTKTMRVKLKAGENQLKDVKLFKLNNLTGSSINYGFTHYALSRPETLTFQNGPSEAAVRFTAPKEGSVLRAAHIYFLQDSTHTGNKAYVGVLGFDEHGRLRELIPFREYIARGSGWAYFDFSEYYIAPREPIFVAVRYVDGLSESIGIAYQAGASNESYQNSFAFNHGLVPMTRNKGVSEGGYAITTDWYHGTFADGAGQVEEPDFGDDEPDHTIPFERDDHADGKIVPPPGSFGGDSKNPKNNHGSKSGSEKQDGFHPPADGEGYRRRYGTDSGKNANENDPRIAPGSTEPVTMPEAMLPHTQTDVGEKILHGHTVPGNVIERAWRYDSAIGKWQLLDEYDRPYKNVWLPVYTISETREGKHYSWFYFNADGYMHTGWYTDEKGNTFYLEEQKGSQEGELAFGLREINGSGYYFNTAAQNIEGLMLTGWMEDEQKNKYYFSPEKGENYGKMAVGWENIDGSWKFFETRKGETYGRLLEESEDSQEVRLEKPAV